MKRRMKLSLSTKFALTFIPLILFVMLMTIYAVHITTTIQFTERYENELQAYSNAIDRELNMRRDSIRKQLGLLAEQIRDDHDFRLHVSVYNEADHPYVVDYAPRFMSTMGLQALEITDANGSVLSSGQFRHAFGGNSLRLIRNIQQAEDDVVFAWFDHPDGYKLCLTAIESFRIGNRTFFITGGIAVDEVFLRSLQLSLQNVLLFRTPTQLFSSDPNRFEASILEEIDTENVGNILPERLRENFSFSQLIYPVADRNSVSEGAIYLLHSRSELVQLLSSLNEKILAITIVGVIFVIILAFWQTGNVALPLRRLAHRAENLSLDSLDDNFNIRSRDEVGVLNDALKNMVQRLRKSRLDLAVAEQKAALAEIARKVNHDIKNGFIPIRNVMHHWGEVADTAPEMLVQVFKERRETIDESIRYLQEIAQNYAQPNKTITIEPVNINTVLDAVVRNYKDLPGSNCRIVSSFENNGLNVGADHNQLRRAFENVVSNAVEACREGGEVKVSTIKENTSIIVQVEDDGTGIPEEIRSKLFKMHVTTKSNGIGIGLMSAHSIIKEFNGSISLEDREGGGTRVRITLPEFQAVTPAVDNIIKEESVV